jgi:hypothetical protein
MVENKCHVHLGRFHARTMSRGVYASDCEGSSVSRVPRIAPNFQGTPICAWRDQIDGCMICFMGVGSARGTWREVSRGVAVCKAKGRLVVTLGVVFVF